MYYVGLDIGGTKCAVTLGNVHDGQIVIEKKSNLQRQETPICRCLKSFAM